MRVILEFDLPDEAEEYRTATRAGAMACVIEDVRQYVRSRLKYESPGKEASKDLESIRDLIHEGLAND